MVAREALLVMTRTCYYLVALLFSCTVSGFSSSDSNKFGRRREAKISMTKKDVNDGSSITTDGAGSWRSKAKDYQANNGDSNTLRTLKERKRLNIAFVTGNAMKQREINIILSNNAATSADGESLVNLRILDVDLPEIQEINTEAVAKNKAIQGAQLAGGACVVEDTSLEFNALGGMPGPFIKWFQDSLGSEGLYKILQAYEDKSATAVCTLAFCPYPHADPVLFTGRCTGTIVEPVEGRGFGWDSIFVPDGQSVPFSLMKTEQKCELSHRSMAVMEWADWLGNNFNELYDRQYGKPAIGHKGLDFRPSSSEQ